MLLRFHNEVYIDFISSQLTHKNDLQTSHTTVWFKILLASSSADGCFDEIFVSQVNYQWYRYNVDFLQCHTFKDMYIENGDVFKAQLMVNVK